MSLIELYHCSLPFSNWCYLRFPHVICQSINVRLVPFRRCISLWRSFRYNAHFAWLPEWAL